MYNNYTRFDFIPLVPPVRGLKRKITESQDTKDIIEEVCNSHNFFLKDYENIAEYFRGNNVEDTCKNIFIFLKNNIRYKIESESEQNTKSLSVILHDGFGDCKHYAQFSACVCDCLNMKWRYRFASYNILNSDPQHVFCVVMSRDRQEVWIDPVLPSFNLKNPEPFYFKDVIFEKKNGTK